MNYEQAPPPPTTDPVASSQSVQPPRIWRPLENRLLAVKVVFSIIAAIWVLAVASDILELLLANRLIAGEQVSASEFTASDNRQLLVSWVQRAALVAGATAFIMWLFRAYQNVDATAPGTRRYGHGWAIGGWFVPIMWFWRPKQVLNDVWKGGEDSREPGWLPLSFWTVWVASLLAGNIARRQYSGADTPEEYRSAIIAYIVTDGLGAAAAVLAILVAIALTNNLNRRMHATHTGRFTREAAVPAEPARNF